MRPHAHICAIMVRSVGSPASSVGPPSSSSSDSPASDDPRAQAARQRAVEEQAHRHRRNRFEWFRRNVVAVLCEQAMERPPAGLGSLRQAKHGTIGDIPPPMPGAYSRRGCGVYAPTTGRCGSPTPARRRHHSAQFTGFAGAGK